MQKTTSGFSLIEIMVGILIISIIMISAFQALSAVGVAKIKLIEQTEIEKQAYFASEKFFEMIKKGGVLDYEEYWNRYNYDINYDGGHFLETSGFGNFGDNGTVESINYRRKPYYCLSGLSSFMGTGGCLDHHNVQFAGSTASQNKSGPQRYLQYQEHFIDRNSDMDNDGGNEDGSSETFRRYFGDDDDLFLGIGPKAFSGSSDENKVGELYLINGEGNERTYFRWNVKLDPDANPGTCSGGEEMTGTGCLGTIEFLKLTGEDYGFDHNFGIVDNDGSQGDGLMDTWFIHDDFHSSAVDIVAGSNSNNYWQAIFPSSINVSDVEFYAYPNKSLEYSWRDTDRSIFISPYIQIKMKLQPSIKNKRKINGAPPVVNIATTIQLSSLDLK